MSNVSKNDTSWRWVLISGGLLSLLAVLLGAFAAHALKNTLDSYSLGVFETAVKYQMHHGIGLLIVAILSSWSKVNLSWLKKSAIFLLIGTIIFSGSLYFLAITGVRWLGAVTPIGGTSLIIGWLFLLLAVGKVRTFKE